MSSLTPDPTPERQDELTAPARPELSEEEKLQIAIADMRTQVKNEFESADVAVEGYEHRKVLVGTVLTIDEKRDDFTVRLAIDTRKKLVQWNMITVSFKRLVTGEVKLRSPEQSERRYMHFCGKGGEFGHLLPSNLR